MIFETYYESYRVLLKQKSLVVAFLITLFISNNIANFALLAGEKDNSFIHILFQLLQALVLIWLQVSLRLGLYNNLIKRRDWDFIKTMKEGLFETPAYLLYSFFFSLLLLIGFAFLVLPGFYVYFAFFLAPTVAIFEPKKESYFSTSKQMAFAKPFLHISFLLFDFFLVFLTALGTVASGKLITTGGPTSLAGFFLNIPITLLSIFFASLTVLVYQRLRDSLVSP